MSAEEIARARQFRRDEQDRIAQARAREEALSGDPMEAKEVEDEFRALRR